MTFKTYNDGGPYDQDYEVWTCDTCGYEIVLQGVGGDVADCPKCLTLDMEQEAARYQEDLL